MAVTNALSLTSDYPADKYNVLVPIQTVTEIADIQKPVMNVVYISTENSDKEIYFQRKGGKEDNYQDLYSLTRKGLLKLMRAAGIRIVSSRAVLPSTCQKCVEANRMIGQPVNCGACRNKDVKYTVVISAPQLTGQDIQYECSREINVADEIAGMNEAQRAQFMKFRAEHCESKALNRALRAAMLIKPTYTLPELKKPFVVAYLTPNLNNPDVKQRAINSYFSAAGDVFGGAQGAQPSVQRIRLEDDDDDIPDNSIPTEMLDPEPAPQYEQPHRQAPRQQVPAQQIPAQQAPAQQGQVSMDDMPDEFYTCSNCGNPVVDSGKWMASDIVAYSQRVFGRTLCADCQHAIRAAQRTQQGQGGQGFPQVRR